MAKVHPAMLRSATILLAEDDENDAMLMRRAFEKASISNPLRVVRSGDEAICYLNGDGIYQDRKTYPLPILAILDIKMPRKTGFEVIEWIKTKPALRAMPLIVLSSSNQIPDIEKAFSLGVNSYLLKPSSFGELVEMVQLISKYWILLNQHPRFRAS
jgi:CheY-like chemotaxis protein